MKHTPGPWEIDNEKSRGIGGERQFKVVSSKPYGGLIGYTSAWWTDVESAKANARLIAAAPELLLSLKQMVELVKQYHTDSDDCDHSVGICYCGEYSWLDEAERIITKVTEG